MKRKTFNTWIYVKKARPLKDGKYPVYMRITVDARRCDIALKVGVYGKDWNAKKEKAEGSDPYIKTVNETIESARYRLHKIKLAMEDQGKTITVEGVRDKFIDRQASLRTIVILFENHNAECETKVGVQITRATSGRYKTCLKHIKGFIKSEYRCEDLPVTQINRRFYERFEYYLKNNVGCAHNTAIKYIRNFNKIARLAVESGWIERSPYKDMGYRLEEIDKPYLTIAELQRIYVKEISTERLDKIRDLFVFCCYTGLAFMDLKELTSENLHIGIDNNKWILKKRRKTGIISKIPLFDVPEKILDKYQEFMKVSPKGTLLPVPSNQKMNAYLKELAGLCEIDKVLTTHTARRTFATTIMLHNGVSMEAVSGMLGHTSLFMTRKYAKIDEYYIARETDKVRSKYGSV